MTEPRDPEFVLDNQLDDVVKAAIAYRSRLADAVRTLRAIKQYAEAESHEPSPHFDHIVHMCSVAIGRAGAEP